MNRKKTFLLAAAEAFLLLLFCTKSSFLYPFNNWTDANCFFTVGKSILDGKVLYRDIIEQKGLLLYLVHSFASLFSLDTFSGVFLAEVIAGTFTVYYLHRISSLFCGNLSFILSPVTAALMFTSSSFSHGDSAEELCMPFLLCCTFLSFQAVCENRPIGKKNWYVIGILASCVFWMKYSVCTFFAGFVIVPFILQIRRKKIRPVLTAVISGFAGLMTVTVPMLLYFILNNALGEMYEVYIYDNLFLYSAKMVSRSGFLITGIRKNELLLCLVLICAVWYLFRRKWSLFFHLGFLFLSVAIPVFMLGKRYSYYYYILGFFMIFGISAIGEMILALSDRKNPAENKKSAAGTVLSVFSVCLSVFLSVCLCLFCSPNRSFRNVKKEDLPQSKFAVVISSVPDATLLNYGFLDYGFYTAANILPDTRYFCTLNNSIPGMNAEMESYIKNGTVDFVVTRNQRLNSSGYTLISDAEDTYEQKHFTYYLYERNDLLSFRASP